MLLSHYSARRFGLHPTAPRDNLGTPLRHTPRQSFLRPAQFKTYRVTRHTKASRRQKTPFFRHRWSLVARLPLLSYNLARCNTGFARLHSVLGLSRSFFACFTAPTTAQSLPRAKQHFNASLCNATHRGLPASATSS